MTMPVDDIDRIMAVMRSAFPAEYGEAWNRRQVEDALFIGNCHYRLANCDGQIADPDQPVSGFYLSRGGFEEEELLLLAVDPSFRRRGIGRFLLELLASDARRRGAAQLLLEMRRGNPAEHLYTGFGFAPIGVRPNYYRTLSGERIDAITFARPV